MTFSLSYMWRSLVNCRVTPYPRAQPPSWCSTPTVVQVVRTSTLIEEMHTCCGGDRLPVPASCNKAKLLMRSPTVIKKLSGACARTFRGRATPMCREVNGAHGRGDAGILRVDGDIYHTSIRSVFRDWLCCSRSWQNCTAKRDTISCFRIPGLEVHDRTNHWQPGGAAILGKDTILQIDMGRTTVATLTTV